VLKEKKTLVFLANLFNKYQIQVAISDKKFLEKYSKQIDLLRGHISPNEEAVWLSPDYRFSPGPMLVAQGLTLITDPLIEQIHGKRVAIVVNSVSASEMFLQWAEKEHLSIVVEHIGGQLVAFERINL